MSSFDKLLSQFRGIPSHYQPEPKQRAKELSGFIDEITEKYSIEGPRTEVLIIQNWREIVGARDAHRCKPDKITAEGALVVTTTNSTLRMELQFNRTKILKNLQRVCGSDTITDLIVR